jgi:hypothetical protein
VLVLVRVLVLVLALVLVLVVVMVLALALKLLLTMMWQLLLWVKGPLISWKNPCTSRGCSCLTAQSSQQDTAKKLLVSRGARPNTWA